MKHLEKIDNLELFPKISKSEMGKIYGGITPYKTYVTSGAGGGTPPAGTASDTNDLSTKRDGSDWKNLSASIELSFDESEPEDLMQP